MCFPQRAGALGRKKPLKRKASEVFGLFFNADDIGAQGGELLDDVLVGHRTQGTVPRVVCIAHRTGLCLWDDLFVS
jgi:hypothetical protein